MTSRIVDALRHHLPGTAAAAAAVPSSVMPAAPAEPDLRARLMDSLRTLMPEGLPSDASSQGAAGPSEELLRVMRQRLVEQAPSGAEAVPVGTGPASLGAPAPEAPATASFPREAAAKPAAPPGTVPPPEFSPREDDVESEDEGVPHRLPPGFGAIPEDIVEERARQREEERMLRIKATQPCRFGRRCKRRDCPNAHPEGRDIDTELNPCAFGRRCKRKGCFYDHPEGRVIDDDPMKGMCKFGARCSRPDCLYDHPEGRAPVAGDARICYFCHDSGHIATDCPRNPESWNFNREAERRLEQRAITAG